MNFEKTAHGNYGEQLVKTHLEQKGWSVTGPYLGDKLFPTGPHDYDFRCEKEAGIFSPMQKLKPEGRSKPIPGLIASTSPRIGKPFVKTKSSPALLIFCFSFSMNHSRKFTPFLFLSLANTGLRKLFDSSLLYREPGRAGEIVYFALSLTKPIRPLNCDECRELKRMSERTRNYRY